MKAFMMLGAIIGFVIGSGFGLASHTPWPAALWRACAASVMAALLMRWWSRKWLEGLRVSLDQKHRTSLSSDLPEKPAGKT